MHNGLGPWTMRVLFRSQPDEPFLMTVALNEQETASETIHFQVSFTTQKYFKIFGNFLHLGKT